jgi:hypothetical protein
MKLEKRQKRAKEKKKQINILRQQKKAQLTENKIKRIEKYHISNSKKIYNMIKSHKNNAINLSINKLNELIKLIKNDIEVQEKLQKNIEPLKEKLKYFENLRNQMLVTNDIEFLSQGACPEYLNKKILYEAILSAQEKIDEFDKKANTMYNLIQMISLVELKNLEIISPLLLRFIKVLNVVPMIEIFYLANKFMRALIDPYAMGKLMEISEKIISSDKRKPIFSVNKNILKLIKETRDKFKTLDPDAELPQDNLEKILLTLEAIENSNDDEEVEYEISTVEENKEEIVEYEIEDSKENNEKEENVIKVKEIEEKIN